ncbi:MAG: hypothetical protein Q7T16_05170 [Candidatus Burarchaeum sp.]|nr:hypothetical protein [Candidatus Burarchaeum sp.]MDO8340020.1 hypothetical protein [Candidatus Burarchaeum sp.]
MEAKLASKNSEFANSSGYGIAIPANIRRICRTAMAPGSREEDIQKRLQNAPLVEAICMRHRLDAEQAVHYSMNVSKKASIDLIDSILVVKKLQQEFGGQELIVVVAGNRGIINADRVKGGKESGTTDIHEIAKSLHKLDVERKALVEKIFEYLRVKGTVLLLSDIWNDPLHWRIFAGLMKNKQSLVLDRKYSGKKMALGEIPTAYLGAIPKEILRAHENELAPALYIPLEIAEAVYLQERYDAGAKIGPVAEAEYDIHIGRFFNIIQLRQPVSLTSTDKRPRPVAPYILREEDEDFRISFEDTYEKIVQKLLMAPPNSPLFYQVMEGRQKQFSLSFASNTMCALLRHLTYVAELEKIKFGESCTEKSILWKNGLRLSMPALGELGIEDQQRLYTEIRRHVEDIAGQIGRLLIDPLKNTHVSNSDRSVPFVEGSQRETS